MSGEAPTAGFASGRRRLPNGIDLAFSSAGPETGPAVLFLHGVTDFRGIWLPTMRALRALRPELRLVAVDLRGHGESSYPPGRSCRRRPEGCFRMRDFAADILAFMDAAGIRRAALVGHSMGSLIAQEIALAEPARTEALLLVGGTASALGNAYLAEMVLGPVLEGRVRRAVAARGLAFPEDAIELGMADVEPDLLSWLAEGWCASALAVEELPAAALRHAARLSLGTWIGAFRSLLAVDNRERLHSLAVPTLALWGVQDVIFPFEPDQRALKEALAAAAAATGLRWAWKQYGSVPLSDPAEPQTDFGHNLPWEAPQPLARDIAEFLDAARSRPA